MPHPFVIENPAEDQSVFVCGVHFLRTGSLRHFSTHRSAVSIDIFPATPHSPATATNWTIGAKTADITWNLDDAADLKQFEAYLQAHAPGEAAS